VTDANFNGRVGTEEYVHSDGILTKINKFTLASWAFESTANITVALSLLNQPKNMIYCSLMDIHDFGV